MANFEIKNKTVNTQYEYTNGTVKVNGSYSRNQTEDALTSINGQMYLLSDDSYIGNFHGENQGGTMKYSLSGATSGNGAIAWQAIADIEVHAMADENGDAE